MTVSVPATSPPRRATRAWIVYDLANTIFALGVVGLYLPSWLTSVGLADWTLSVTQASAGLIIICTAPWLGARSDHRRRRVPVLVAATTVAVLATLTMGSGPEWWTLAALGIAIVAVNLGGVAYDALLPYVSTPATRGSVSGLGVGVGYVGSFIGLAIGTVTLDILDLGFAPTFGALGLGFLIFAVPSFFLIPEDEPPREGSAPTVGNIARETIASWRKARSRPSLFRFLISRFMYADAINTLIGGFLAIYVQEELGFTTEDTRNLLGVAIAAAIGGGIVVGRLVNRVGAHRVLVGAMVTWQVAFIVGILAATTDTHGLAWGLAPLGGIALGATWTSDRVLLVDLSPPEHIGEFYGLYATVGRFATVLGPLIWAMVVDVLNLGRTVALAVLGGFVLLATLILRTVRA
ncbi:MAG: MFS transporter [Acidimicrobiia bacterium]|nr:MFS transporter [Acidimicrobiia bacterium]